MSFHKNKAVERMLQLHPDTRGDDRKLIMRVWEMYNFGFSEQQRKLFLGHRLPSTETIRRTRQKLQQEGRYLPSLTKINERKTLAVNTREAMVEEKQEQLFQQNLGRNLRTNL